MQESCGRIAELIPWVVNQSAADADRLEVVRHIASCPRCRADYVGCAVCRYRMTETVRGFEMPRTSNLFRAVGAPPPTTTRAIGVRHIVLLLEALGVPSLVLGGLETAVKLPALFAPPTIPVPLIGLRKLAR